MTIAAFLHRATEQLQAVGIVTARLDAQVLLTDVLGQSKSWLLAHDDTELSPEVLSTLEVSLRERCNRVPLAYIRRSHEFYGRQFTVNPSVLIPRPETEMLVEMIKKYVHTGILLDVGTGSGAIAITAALEVPTLTVDACDVSPQALAVATANATRLKAAVHFFESDLLKAARSHYDAIVANLPYVSRVWDVSPETAAEPKLALFAGDDGLELIYKLITQVPAHLKAGGHLILEADPRQHADIQKAANEHGLVFEAAQDFGLCFTQHTSI